MARQPNLTRDQLQPEGQKFDEAMADSRCSGKGPYGVPTHSPGRAARVAHTVSDGQDSLDLPEALRETLTLATAWEIKSQ
jgi:hypothetical protein